MVALRHCPPAYFHNCANASLYCARCAAGSGPPDGKLHYQPLQPSDPHPYRPDARRRQVVRRARREEKRAQQQLIRQTVNSGALFGDGDYRILDGVLRGEHKHRQRSRNFHLSHAEYQKGRAQGVSCWVVTNQDGERVVILTEQAFSQLLAAVWQDKNKGETDGPTGPTEPQV